MFEEAKSRSTALHRRKLPAKAMPVVFACFMSAIMAFLMSSVIVATNTGIDQGYPLRVFRAYSLAMPVAFACVLVVRPMVIRLVSMVCHHPGQG